jgi:hypothetical protein
MNSLPLRILALILVCPFLNSCSGPPQGWNGSGGNGGGGGNTGQSGTATLTLLLTAQPELYTVTDHVTYAVGTTITGVTLNPASGNPIPLTLAPDPYPVEFYSLQASGAFLGTLSVPAGTYNSITLTFSSTTDTFQNGPNGTIKSLAGNTCPSLYCEFILASGSSQLQTSPFPITLTDGQHAGLALRFNANNAIGVSNNVLNVSYSAANAFTALSLPRLGTPTGYLDTVEDFLGQVTAVSSSSVTVKSGFGQSLTASIQSSSVMLDPQGLCSGGVASTSCLAVGQTVAIDVGVNADGSLALLSADLIDSAAADEVAGTVELSGPSGQFLLIVSDKIVASSNSSMAGLQRGDMITVTTNNSTAFSIDPDELTSQIPASASTNFQSASDLFYGETVMIQPSSITGSALTGLAASTSKVRLRFSSFSATDAANNSSLSFVAAPMSPITFFQELGKGPQVQMFTGATAVDGISASSSLAVNDPVAVRCILMPNPNQPCYAVKVRDRVGEP